MRIPIIGPIMIENLGFLMKIHPVVKMIADAASPATLPSTVLLGLMEEKWCRPMADPTRYAAESHMKMDVSTVTIPSWESIGFELGTEKSAWKGTL